MRGRESGVRTDSERDTEEREGREGREGGGNIKKERKEIKYGGENAGEGYRWKLN